MNLDDNDDLEEIRVGENLKEERGKRLDQQSRDKLNDDRIPNQKKSAFLRFAIKEADIEKFLEVDDELGGNV